MVGFNLTVFIHLLSKSCIWPSKSLGNLYIVFLMSTMLRPNSIPKWTTQSPIKFFSVKAFNTSSEGRSWRCLLAFSIKKNRNQFGNDFLLLIYQIHYRFQNKSNTDNSYMDNAYWFFMSISSPDGVENPVVKKQPTLHKHHDSFFYELCFPVVLAFS